MLPACSLSDFHWKAFLSLGTTWQQPLKTRVTRTDKYILLLIFFFYLCSYVLAIILGVFVFSVFCFSVYFLALNPLLLHIFLSLR